MKKYPGIDLIASERLRQVEKEGFSPQDDLHYTEGELVQAALKYAASGIMRDSITFPFDYDWWKPTTRIRDLVKAGALIAAEIDRLVSQDNPDYLEDTERIAPGIHSQIIEVDPDMRYLFLVSGLDFTSFNKVAESVSKFFSGSSNFGLIYMGQTAITSQITLVQERHSDENSND